MYPKIGPVPIYGTLHLLGFVAFFLISRRAANRLALRHRVWIMVSACYILGMIPGAKYLYHVRRLEFDPMVIFSAKHYIQGGMWGGLLAYFPLAIAATLMLTKNRKAALDLVAVSLPIPWAMGKLGCLFNGCCHGKPCSLPWAITFPEGASAALVGIPVHPTQIYEILLMGLLVLVFNLLQGEQWRGTMLLWFVGIYGFGRAAIATSISVRSLSHSLYARRRQSSQSACCCSGEDACQRKRTRLPHPLDKGQNVRPDNDNPEIVCQSAVDAVRLCPGSADGRSGFQSQD